MILAGTNDIAGNTGPMTLEMIEDNFRSMVELAKANGIKVVMSSVMPVCDYIRPQTERRPPAQIIALNEWIKDYSAKNKLVYLSYYSAMIDDQKMCKRKSPTTACTPTKPATPHGTSGGKSHSHRPPQPLTCFFRRLRA